MPRASSRRLATAKALRTYPKRKHKLRRTVSNRTIIALTSLLSKKYGVLPCLCEHDPIRMLKYPQALILSKSSNAFWHRNNKSQRKLITKEQQRNNSTAFETQQPSSSGSRNLQTIRKAVAQRFKRNNKKKMPTITARSVIHNRKNTNVIKRRNIIDYQPVDSSNILQDSPPNPSSVNQFDSQHYSYDSHASYDNNEDDENETLDARLASIRTEQQNINATDSISRTIQGTSQTNMHDLDSSNNRLTTPITSNTTRNTTTRSPVSSSKRKQSSKKKQTSKISRSNKKTISASKRKKSKVSLSLAGSSTNVKKVTYRPSPFSDPNMFHYMPRMQNSDEITKDNVHENHLCCKAITSVKGLSTSDKKKLIEDDYLTLISLLPIYLGSQGNFQHQIREKTNISHDGAIELDRLMNEWGSARLFIGANNHYKTLTQKI